MRDGTQLFLRETARLSETKFDERERETRAVRRLEPRGLRGELGPAPNFLSLGFVRVSFCHTREYLGLEFPTVHPIFGKEMPE